MYNITEFYPNIGVSVMSGIEKDREKVLGCWMGKNIGGTLGGPFEGIPFKNNLTYYDPVPTGSMPNDDLELQAMYVAALDRMEKPEVNREILAEIWKKHMNFHCDEYAVAMRNLALGIRPPWTGIFDNYYVNGMGAAIRSELWACLAPGNPELAVKFAREDACIDHSGDGIEAEVFFAALESLAFVETDVRKLIDTALTYLSSDSILAEGIRTACSQWDQTHNWETVRDALFERYATEFKTNVRINVPFTALALLSGGGDFGKTICDAANCGMDTDCTAATAGAILGILNPDGIPEIWRRPVGHELVVRSTAITGLEFPPTIEEFTDQILGLRRRIPQQVNVASSPEPDYTSFRIHVDVSMQTNPHWYRVALNKMEWKTQLCNPIAGKLEVPEPFRGSGGQVVLRFQFDLQEDGEYTLMFNSPTSNQVYLDPDVEVLHDDQHMLFGRQRLFLDVERPGGEFACSERPVIFGPTLGGAPLNQYRRHLPLSKGRHILIVALEPLPFESSIRWGMGIGVGSRFLVHAFR